MTCKWNYTPLKYEQEKQDEDLEAEFASTPTILTLLRQRGITTLEQAREFFNPSLSQLHDPFLMPGMERAVARLNRAMGAKEKILVFGDYDVDGTTAVSLVYRYLLNFYSNLDYYIPTREDDGYGISRQNIDAAHEQGVKLIIILDCGIKANDEIAYAKSLGIDFIICDHHMADEELPDAVAILNPKLPGSTYPCPYLSGCGVGFKLMQAFAISNSLDLAELYSMLDLVAVSIATDIVPMVGENRILAYHGLKRLNSNPNLGLRAVMRTCGLSSSREVTISDVVFRIGPRLNASGRMQSGGEAVELLTSRDLPQAIERAREIDGYNQDRKQLDKRITQEAIDSLQDSGVLETDQKSLVVYNKTWHRGIIGIVASRLTETYYKPSVVLTYSNGLATGSSRSAQGFDVYSAIDSVRDLVENFGGHAYAAGVSLKEENVPEFARRFEEYVREHITEEQLTPGVDIAAVISFSEITPEFLTQLRRFNPFGPGNSKPVFCTRGVMDFGTSKLVGKNMEHVKLELVDDTSGKVFNGIAFNKAHLFNAIKTQVPFTICYTIEEPKHPSPSSPMQLQIKEIKI